MRCCSRQLLRLLIVLCGAVAVLAQVFTYLRHRSDSRRRPRPTVPGPSRARETTREGKGAAGLARIAAGAAGVPASLLEKLESKADSKQLASLRKVIASVDAQEARLTNASVIWPSIFLIGAPKAASSTLHKYLTRHPQLCSAKSLQQGKAAKEVGILFAHRIKNFLHTLYGPANTGGHDPKCRTPPSTPSLTSHPTPRSAPLYMDNHPLYLHAPDKFALRMREVVSHELHASLHFLIIVREPIARALSQINHQRRAACDTWYRVSGLGFRV